MIHLHRDFARLFLPYCTPLFIIMHSTDATKINRQNRGDMIQAHMFEHCIQQRMWLGDKRRKCSVDYKLQHSGLNFCEVPPCFSLGS